MRIKMFLLLHGFIITQISFSQTRFKMVEQPLQLKKNLSFKLKVSKGYKINIAAKGLERSRFFAKSPDGRIFIADMHDKSDNKKGNGYFLCEVVCYNFLFFAR